MEKIIKKLSVILVGCFILFSCKKEDSKNNETTPSVNTELIGKINSWLDSKKIGAPNSQIEKIETLRQNLIFGQLHLEKYLESDQLVIVPIDPKFTSANNVGKSPTNYLLLVLSDQNTVKKGNLVQFVTTSTQKQVPQDIFSKIFTFQKFDFDGQFTVLSITDDFRYEIKFEKGSLKSFAEQKNKKKSDSTGKVEGDCINWYLVTTYYEDGVPVDQTWDYLFTTCSDECNSTRMIKGNNYKVSCGGSSSEDMPYEFATSKPVTWTVSQWQTYWIVASQEQLDGKKVSSEPQGGHFTGIKHLTSYLTVGNSDWEQYSSVVSLDDERTARAYVTGKVTYRGNGYWEVVSGYQTWRFDSVF